MLLCDVFYICSMHAWTDWILSNYLLQGSLCVHLIEVDTCFFQISVSFPIFVCFLCPLLREAYSYLDNMLVHVSVSPCTLDNFGFVYSEAMLLGACKFSVVIFFWKIVSSYHWIVTLFVPDNALWLNHGAFFC